MQIQWFDGIVQAGHRALTGLWDGSPDKSLYRHMSWPDIIEQARSEWEDAQKYYNSVTDSDLIDHAVFRIQAAEKRYMYLMKKARQEGFVHSPYNNI